MKKLLTIFFTILLISCDSDSIIVNIPDVINKEPSAVESILGKPDTAFIQPVLNKKVLTYIYTPYEVEFRFFSNRASEIIVRNPGDIPYDKQSLRLFGLTPEEPASTEKNVLLRWNNKEGIETISFYTKYRNEDGTPQKWEILFKGKK